MGVRSGYATTVRLLSCVLRGVCYGLFTLRLCFAVSRSVFTSHSQKRMRGKSCLTFTWVTLRTRSRMKTLQLSQSRLRGSAHACLFRWRMLSWIDSLLYFDVGSRCSGSDISVLVREALMEPLRKCQQAQFFTRVSGSLSFPLTASSI